ncbi:hypothetical protein ONV78_20965 [Hahella sp. CR1]|uniref:hypothetical protein n=1 Tax=Hahella sp. CR1 TaxID=2992807 RepID=UPI0024414FAD|nr:hypothetical protein [Hahella sp. CR1]MDG9670222.1 hypothetical protein [Hahella sp. CR1]
MRNLVLILILTGVAHFAWNKVTEEKPDWFLDFVADSILFDSTVNINLSADPGWTENLLVQQFDHLYLVCQKESSDLGDRVCWTRISSLNGVPAKDIAFFFRDDRYRFLRVTFDVEKHRDLKSYLDDNFRYVGISPGSKEKVGQELGVWKTLKSTLATYVEAPRGEDEVMLTWSVY